MRKITWRRSEDGYACLVDEVVLATVSPRPRYCDRGHWWVHCNLNDADGQDGFPRYYMRREVAFAETEAFLKWRLWKQRGERA